MELSASEPLATVTAIPLSNGTMFHSRVIGLPYFRVPLRQIVKEEFTLAPPSEDQPSA